MICIYWKSKYTLKKKKGSFFSRLVEKKRVVDDSVMVFLNHLKKISLQEVKNRGTIKVVIK
jgi:hypothetical protein